jgi:DNA-binding transcriptional MerR regulator
VDLLSISDFAQRSRLSAKALRLYDELGLLRPTRVDPGNGYRWYGPGQLDRARLVAALRGLDMPLARIAPILDLAPAAAAAAVAAYWGEVEAAHARRRALAAHLRDRLTGTRSAMPTIAVRDVPARDLLTVRRHLHAADLEAFLTPALVRLLQAAPRSVSGLAGAPFVVYHGEVSADSDGPVELCRPVAAGTGERVAAELADVVARSEPDHQEAYVRLTRGEADTPLVLAAYDALGDWLDRNDRWFAGPPRQIFIADWRTVTPDQPALDVAVPLASAAGRT